MTARDLLSCGQKWLAYLTPFFKESERKQAGCQHRLLFSQSGILRQPDLSQAGRNRSTRPTAAGCQSLYRLQPNKITVIFGRKVTKHYKGKLQTVIEDLELPNPA